MSTRKKPHSTLALQERLLRAIAYDAPRSTHTERQARAALVAVVAAIHNVSLDRLLEALTGFMQDELSGTDALGDGEMFDLLSEVLIELGAVADDFDEMEAIERK